ncbi:ABC transporter ATP-binding protein [Opitutaceae bacterium]|nr:ABC transporter ATP-binding protein [Opitutaceae bacterium]
MSDAAPQACSVRLQSVAKKFGDGPAVLQDIDLEAAPRDFVAIIGPSGCGKSTLLRMLAGLVSQNSGQIEIDGSIPGRDSPELSYVFQEPTLLAWQRVAENVELPLILRGVPSAQRTETVQRCLRQVRLDDRANAFPRQLSGGQQMRVSIARALALDPRLLLLDEPFGALDEMTRNHLNEELLSLREESDWTAFFVTHSVAEAVFLANRVIIMSANPGRIAHEVSIDLPYPRPPATREESRFQQLVAKVSGLLRSVEEDTK